MQSIFFPLLQYIISLFRCFYILINVLVDGDWCTAPSTPTTVHKASSVEGQSSSGQSVVAPDPKGPVPVSSSAGHSQLPRHISTASSIGEGAMNGNVEGITQDQHQAGSGKYSHVGVPGGQNLASPSGNAVVTPSTQPPSRVHHGFVPANPGPFDATKAGDLPGSRNEHSDKVITTPPHSQTTPSQTGQRTRARSIEESDKSREKYAPGESGKKRGEVGDTGVQGSSSFCLGLSSLILAQHDADSEGSEGRKNDSLKRSGSVSSEASTISVRGGVYF